MTAWAYRVVIDHRPDAPNDAWREWAFDGARLGHDERWKYVGEAQYFRRRSLSPGPAFWKKRLLETWGCTAHVERAPIGPWEEM